MSTSTTTTADLPAGSGLTGLATSLPSPGEYPKLDIQSQVPIIIGISVAFMVMSTIVVALRLYTRYRVIKVAGDDDITIGIAQVRFGRQILVSYTHTTTSGSEKPFIIYIHVILTRTPVGVEYRPHRHYHLA